MSKTSPADDGGAPTVDVGNTVFDEHGKPVGIVRERTDGGFVVSVSTDRPESQRSTSGEFGEAYLMWRCMECGEMGNIESLPEQCPDCAASRESLYYWTED